MIMDNVEKQLKKELKGQELLKALKIATILRRGIEQERGKRLKSKAQTN